MNDLTPEEQIEYEKLQKMLRNAERFAELIVNNDTLGDSQKVGLLFRLSCAVVNMTEEILTDK